MQGSSSRLSVATHIVTLLALADGPLTSSQIAWSVQTNPVVIRRLIASLRDAELVTVSRGRSGGATLARHPDTITMAAVLRAVQAGPLFPPPANHPNTDCACGAHIGDVLGAAYEDAERALAASFERLTVSDLAAQISERQDR